MVAVYVAELSASETRLSVDVARVLLGESWTRDMLREQRGCGLTTRWSRRAHCPC
jgi:hypothetical protein